MTFTPVSTNEALSVQIEALKDLVVGVRDRDIKGINDRLDGMNGREREHVERISANTGSIKTLKVRVNRVESGLKTSLNWRTLLMGILSTLQAAAAWVFSK